MSIAKGISKAAKAQARGLQGKRNAQGDFMPEEVQMKGVQEAVAPDIQNYIDDVKSQIDEIDSQITFARDAAEGRDAGMAEANKITALETEKKRLLKEVVNRLDEEGIEVPPQIQQELDELSKVDEQPQDAALAAWDEMGGNTL